jgi:hypothetical protein
MLVPNYCFTASGTCSKNCGCTNNPYVPEPTMLVLNLFYTLGVLYILYTVFITIDDLYKLLCV